MGKIRAFIAIEFPDEVIREIARIQETLSKQAFTGKMTELENLHLTLKFLGEIDELKLEEVKNRLKEVEFPEMELSLAYAGSFSYKGMPRIVWIKINGKEIYELQKKIDVALEGLFQKEERFMGHLTIARIKYVKDKETFRENIGRIGVKKIEFKTGSFFLKKSELKPLGPVYTNIDEYKSKSENMK